MSISTYAELKTAIANFLARDDLTSVIPDFIQLAEARINRQLETREQEKRATATLSVGDEYTALPTDMREVREVKISSTNPMVILNYLSPAALDKEYAGTSTGLPKGFSIVGSELKLRPIPDSAYTVEIAYIGNVDAIGDASTPTLFTRSPDLYLYGALAEAYAYLLDEGRAAQYDSKFSRALEEIKVDEERSHYGTGGLRIQSSYSKQNAALRS